VAFSTVVTMTDGGGPTATDIYAFSSADGLHWGIGSHMVYPYPVVISGVVEGPAGLLAVSKNIPSPCGGAPHVQAVFRSADGTSWRQVAAFDQISVGDVEGGSAGYVAIGGADEGSNPAWISFDGANWRHVDLTASAFAGVDAIESGTAFAGGFVLAGTTLGPSYGCGGGQEPLRGALWWSADAKTWTRDALPGVTSGATVRMRVRRISDNALLATESSYDAGGGPITAEASWASTDGRTWKSVLLPGSDPNNDIVVTNGQRGLVFAGRWGGDVAPRVYGLRDDLSVAELSQTGDIPSTYGEPTLGPTGLIVVGDGFWVGVPVAG
jgi:hypothetical protein